MHTNALSKANLTKPTQILNWFELYHLQSCIPNYQMKKWLSLTWAYHTSCCTLYSALNNTKAQAASATQKAAGCIKELGSR